MDVVAEQARTRHPEIADDQLRRWLTLLRRPDKLALPEMEELLQAHGRLPESRAAIGQAGAELLIDAIERLRPPDGANREQGLPHEVLRICFIEGAKLFQAAGRLGMSERQLSRERARAIALLKAELETPLLRLGGRDYRPEPIPTIRGFLPRPAVTRKLEAALESHHLVNVHGPPGIGKTSVVADFTSHASENAAILWYRFRPGINVTVEALLFELGEYLAARGSVELADYMEGALPEPDAGLATRLALRGLGDDSHLIVFDDYQLVENDSVIAGMIEEIALRLSSVRIITISRHRFIGTEAGAFVEVGALGRSETQALLEHLGVSCTRALVKALHQWTAGNPHLVKLAASWLRTADPEEVERGVESLRDLAEVQAFLLDNVTELIDSDDRAVLQGASVFRDRFNDDALAFITGRTRGAVLDASLRLVRAYAATRSKSGDSAFFHHSVRDYVYERLDPAQRAELHGRAAEWYERQGQDTEARYHRERAGKTKPRRRRRS